MEFIDTAAGIFVIYTRDTDQIEFDCEFYGPGPWHWGRKDDDGEISLYRRGYETRDDAKKVMGSYVWALVEGYGWP